MVKVIMSYSTRDSSGIEFAKKLSNDLSIYGVKVHVDLPNYRPSEFVGGVWLDAFAKLLPYQDYYILVVTESFGNSNAMKEFEKFKNCPKYCLGICGQQNNSCNLKKIIPCFFVDPSTVPRSICSIGGIREFYTETYEVGFMELINQLFPRPDLTSLRLNDIGAVIQFCKELEEVLNLIIKSYDTAIKLINSSTTSNILDILMGLAGEIKADIHKVYELYKFSPIFVKQRLNISLLRELEKLINLIDSTCRSTNGTYSELLDFKLVEPRKMVQTLNDIIKNEIGMMLKEGVNVRV